MLDFIEQLKQDAAQRQRMHVTRVYEATKATMGLLDFLDEQQIEILAIDIQGERRTPLVHIANSSKCSMFKESYKAYCMGQRKGLFGLETIWRCDLLGCRVQWTERGH